MGQLRGRPPGPDLNSAKRMPPARVCEECGAIIGRGANDYPDNHWEWCSAYVAPEVAP